MYNVSFSRRASGERGRIFVALARVRRELAARCRQLLLRLPRRSAALGGAFALEDFLGIAAVGIHDVQRAGFLALPRMLKRDLLAVGRPCWAAVLALVRRQLLDVLAVGVHQVDVPCAVAVGDKSDLGAVGRPRRVGVAGFRFGQVLARGAVGIQETDFVVAGAIG